MHYTTIPSVALALALASMAAAVPTPDKVAARADDDIWKGVIDPWGEYGHLPTKSKRASIERIDDDNVRIGGRDFSSAEIRGIMKRESIADYQGKIPGCTHDDDPSNVGTPKPQWDVNHGYKIPKDGNDDACTSGHGADHCWTEYYLVEAAIEYFDWQPSGSAANCSADAHSSCSNAVGSLAQSCSTTGMTESNGWDWKIIDIAGQLSYGGGPSRTFGGSLTAGGSYTKSHSEVKYDLTQVCKTDSATVTCSWENPDGERKELCHQVWFADRVQHVWGQAQRVCNKCKGTAGVTVQQNTGDGKVCVRGQKEFEFRVPINKIVHCDGKCHDIESGLPKPENTPRMPFIPPHV